MNLLHEVFGKISFMYAIETSLAVLVFNSTVIKYEVNKQMKVNAYLFPFDAVGSCPMESISQPAKGTWSISKCIGCI